MVLGKKKFIFVVGFGGGATKVPCSLLGANHVKNKINWAEIKLTGTKVPPKYVRVRYASPGRRAEEP